MTGVVDYKGSLRPGPLLGSERNDWFWLIRDTVTHGSLHVSLSLIGAGMRLLAGPASRAPCGR